MFGCAVLSPGSKRMAIVQTEFELLSGDEIPIELEGPARVWVTNQPTLKLIFGTKEYLYPDEVTYFSRPSGSRTWSEIARWKPNQPPATWTPNEEGRWELSASISGRSTEAVPLSIVVVDWSAPEVILTRGLPQDAITGGTTIPLRWEVRDLLYGSERVSVEMMTPGSEWETIDHVPNSGVYDWPVPNRDLTGARVRLSVTDAAGNSKLVPVPGVLTVHGVGPKVALQEMQISRDAVVSIPYVTNGQSMRRVELWTTPDDGVTWLLAGFDSDTESPLELEFDEGRWGVQVVFVDADGNRSMQPVPGDEPRYQLLVDRSEPTVVWGEVSARKIEGLGALGRGSIELVLPYEILDASLAEESVSVRTQIGGLWIDVPGPYRAKGEIRLEHPAVSTALTVRITGSDAAGHLFESTLETWPLELVDPPVIEFTDAPAGWQAAESAVVLAYKTDWDQALEDSVDLAYSLDGVTWTPIASGLPPSGSVGWTLPEQSAHDVRLRINVQGRHRRAKSGFNTAKLGIDATPPVARIIGPSSGYGDPVHVLVEAFDDRGSGVASIELFSRRRGSDRWQFCSSDEIAEGTLPFRPLAEGEYDLWIVAVDGAGNRSLGAEQAGVDEPFVFQAEDMPPGVRMLSFQDGGVFAGGTRHVVFVDFAGGRPSGGKLTVEYSPDDGATWRGVQTVPLSTRSIPWTLPEANLENVRVRVRATDSLGFEYTDVSKQSFMIDSIAPRIELTDAKPVPGGIRLHYRGEDLGGGKLSQVWVYYTEDEGEIWHEWSEPFVEPESFVIPLGVGRYGFALRGIDNAQNRAEPPTSGTRPDRFAEVGPTQEASIALLGPHSGVFPGGSRHYVFWKLESIGSAFTDLPVRLEYRLDAADLWHSIAAGLPPSGKHPWYIPELPTGSRIQLRVVARDLDGNVYEDVSNQMLDIDTTIPKVVYAGPKTSNRRLTEFEYHVQGDEDLESVELWARPVSHREWEKIVEVRLGDALFADLPDGMYAVSLVGVDKAGNRGRPPVAGESGQARLRVDTIRPTLTVDGVGDRERVFPEGGSMVIRPIVTDNQDLSSFPVSVRYSKDGGQSFTMVESFLPNGNEYSWRVPTRPGVYYVEVTAEDFAGNTDRKVFPIQVHATPPEVSLIIDPGGGTLAAGGELQIEWQTKGVDPLHEGATIEATTDGVHWETIGARFSADGTLEWKLPNVDSSRCQIRISVSRPDGLVGKTWSGRFTISKTVPQVGVRGARPAGAPK